MGYRYTVRFYPHAYAPWKVVSKCEGMVEIIASFDTKEAIRGSYWMKQGLIPPYDEWPQELKTTD